jgi:type I restriction enzyme R subunit
VETERRERNVRRLNTEQPRTNTFHVSEEFVYSNGVQRIRPDVIFLINGIPVLLVETKAATRLEGIAEALEQVRRYQREGPELLALLQLFTVTHLVQFYYGATWRTGRKDLFNWREEQDGDFETLVKSFVAPERLLRVLNDYILFTRKDDELSKVVLRPHQMRAVERVVERAADPVKRRALVWHTQGSGKTYTMLVVAKKLIEDARFQNPTVLMLVDRNELQSQLFDNLESIGFSEVTKARSKHHLELLMRRGQRGLIVSMIHKFDGIPEQINARATIFVLVDEAHRSTGGDLGNYLMGALPNATYIGFTGTPIDKTAYGKGTFKVFGADDAQGYLDKYSIRQSIEDGTTVPLHYVLASNDLLVDRETLEREFLSLAELEGVSDPEELNRVLDRAVQLKNLLKNPERMAMVAAFVADHFRQTVEPLGYKAFLVGVDREACVRYKRLLDQHLPSDYSAVVISHAHNDSGELADFVLTDDDEQRIRLAFRKAGELPKILIVTEKLLTGYDAPVLYCMYLDKPMRDHVLLQAIARVNRPYEDGAGRAKPAGFVLDFVGIFDNLERALAFDSQDVAGVIEGLDVLQQEFAEMMETGRTQYLPIQAGFVGDKAVEAVLEHFRDEDTRSRFYQYFRQLQEVYEILSPDAVLRSFLPDYAALTALYQTVRAAYEPYLAVDKSFWWKTSELVQQYTTTTTLGPIRKFTDLGPEALERLAQEDVPDTVKVFNLIKALVDLVAEKGAMAAYLIPIGERADQIAEAFRERQLTTQQALQQLEQLVREYRTAEETRQQSDLSAEGFAALLLLQRSQVQGAEQLAQTIAEAFTRSPYWKQGGDQERALRRAVYKTLVDGDYPVEQMAVFTDQLLRTVRRAGPVA